jgi:2,3-bisphosphoglycerate-independent phosphoglycerate mutase
MTTRPVVLVVLDGFGLRADAHDNAIALARAPRLAALGASCPKGELGASGPDVGLPPGQMGNSEVGHLNLGAGRIAQTDLSRIDTAAADGSMGQNAEIQSLLARARETGGHLHLLGLVSDGGVHSSLAHLLALIDVAARASVPVVVHAFLDGRDTAPRSALGFLAALEDRLAGKGVIGTVSGRFWAMDRDQRWERVARAYQGIVSAEGPKVASAKAAVEASYAADKGDEFVEPVVVGGYGGVQVGKDVGLFFNFRSDRARELSAALTVADFSGFPRPAGHEQPFARFASMTLYDEKLGLPVAFAKETYPDVLGEVLARAGVHQFRCAETEKFAHVTFFFNGGREEPFAGEERELIPSPRDIATYDLRPAMSAAGVTGAVVRALESGKFGFVLVNFANCDMVGHTGKLAESIAAVEAVDAGVGAIVDAALARGGAVLITADHGNCELMKDPVTGGPHTAHTTNPVPFLYVDGLSEGAHIREGGRLSDVAPTVLALLGIAQPAAMTGASLILR